jgi:hypothetical protein
MPSLDELLASAARRTETVTVSLRGDLAREHADAERALSEAAFDEVLLDDDAPAAATEAVAAGLDALAQRVKDIESEIRDATLTFVVANVGKRRWNAIKEACPPTPEQVEHLGRRAEFDVERFPFFAIAESCIEPEGVTPEQIEALEEVMTVAEWDALWNAVLLVNLGSRLPGESVAASAILRRMRPRSEPPATSGPPAASSSVGA